MGSIFYLVIILGILTKTDCDSIEDQLQFTYEYNQAYTPHAVVNFHDIYPHSHAIVPEEASSTPNEDFYLNTISTQFMEFDSPDLKIQPMTPSPRVLLNSSYPKDEPESSSQSTTIPLSSTHEPDEGSIKAVRVKHYQRGVLDLLLPASRVRHFKSVFDTFRRMLSYTFKRR